MEEVHTGGIGRDGAVRPVDLGRWRETEKAAALSGRPLPVPMREALREPAATIAAVLSAAAGRYLAERKAPAAAGTIPTSRDALDGGG